VDRAPGALERYELAHDREERTAKATAALEERDQDLGQTWVSPFTPPHKTITSAERTRVAVHATVWSRRALTHTARWQ